MRYSLGKSPLSRLDHCIDRKRDNHNPSGQGKSLTCPASHQHILKAERDVFLESKDPGEIRRSELTDKPPHPRGLRCGNLKEADERCVGAIVSSPERGSNIDSVIMTSILGILFQCAMRSICARDKCSGINCVSRVSYLRSRCHVSSKCSPTCRRSMIAGVRSSPPPLKYGLIKASNHHLPSPRSLQHHQQNLRRQHRPAARLHPLPPSGDQRLHPLHTPLQNQPDRETQARNPTPH